MRMLPEAVSNYLLRLGWCYGDEEIISRNRAVELFDLDGVGRSPSRFDLKKVENLNGQYIREAEKTRLAGLVAPRSVAHRMSVELGIGVSVPVDLGGRRLINRTIIYQLSLAI